MYINPGSMLAMAVCFLNLCPLIVILRLSVRRMAKLHIGIDDWLVVAALVFTIALCCNVIVGVAYNILGRGNLAPPLDADGNEDEYYGYSEEVALVNKFAYIHEGLLPLQLMFAKLSILFFYRRYLVLESRGILHWISLGSIGITAIWGVLMSAAFWFPCGTKSYLLWDGPLVEAAETCWTYGEEIFAATDPILDLIIIIMPIPKIFALRLPLAKKLMVAAAFMVAILTFAASLARAFILVNIMNNNPGIYADEGIALSEVIYWGLFEAGTAVIIACLPSVRYLFSKKGPLNGIFSINMSTGNIFSARSKSVSSEKSSRAPSVASSGAKHSSNNNNYSNKPFAKHDGSRKGSGGEV